MLLTAKEVRKLAELLEDYPEAFSFEITQSSLTGIGPNTYVEYVVNGKTLESDITDYSCW